MATLKAIGASLVSENSPFADQVVKRETGLDEKMAQLERLVAEKMPWFEDAYARELVREETERSVSVHSDLCKQVQSWGLARKGKFWGGLI